MQVNIIIVHGSMIDWLVNMKDNMST